MPLRRSGNRNGTSRVVGLTLNELCDIFSARKAGVTQMVEWQLPKLQAVGSSPIARSISLNGERILTQEAERTVKRTAAGPLVAGILLLVGLYLTAGDAVGPFILYVALLLLLHPWWNEKWAHAFLLVGTLFFAVWLVTEIQIVLVPFALGLLLAYLLDPLIDRIETWKVPRTAAIAGLVLIALLLFAVVMVSIVPIVIDQIGSLINNVPGYFSQVQGWLEDVVLPWLGRLGFDVSPEALSEAFFGESSQAGQTLQRLLGGALEFTSSLYTLLAQLLNLLLIPVIAFYLLKDYDSIAAWAGELIPPKRRPALSKLGGEIGEALSNYLRGQFAVCVIIAVLYGIGFGIMGIQYAALLGLAAGVLALIPYVGSILTMVIAGIVALLGPAPLGDLFKVVIVFAAVQLLDGNLITPKIMGERFGLHPVIIMFTVLVFAVLLGFVGLLIAVPLTAVLKVVVDQLLERYRGSTLFAVEADQAESAGPVETEPGDTE